MSGIDTEDDEPRGLQKADPKILDGAFARLKVKLTREFHLDVNVREPKINVDPIDWRTGFLSVHDYDRHPEIHEMMKEQVPQALLRDAYRPIWEHAPFDLEFHCERDVAGVQAVAEGRAALVRDPIPWAPLSTDMVHEEQLRRRAFYAEKWKPGRGDDEERKYNWVI